MDGSIYAALNQLFNVSAICDYHRCLAPCHSEFSTKNESMR